MDNKLNPDMDNKLNPDTSAVSAKNIQSLKIEINEINKPNMSQIHKNLLIKIATSIIQDEYDTFNTSLQKLLNRWVTSDSDTVKDPQDFENKKSMNIDVTFFIRGAPEAKYDYKLIKNENQLSDIQNSFPSIELDDLCFLYVNDLKYWALLHIINEKYNYHIAYNYIQTVKNNQLGCIKERFNLEKSKKFRKYLEKICKQNGCSCENQNNTSDTTVNRLNLNIVPFENNIKSVYTTHENNKKKRQQMREEREKALKEAKNRREKKRKAEEEQKKKKLRIKFPH